MFITRMTDEERAELSRKLADVNKRSEQAPRGGSR